MQQRPGEVQTFLDRLEEAIAKGVSPTSRAARLAEALDQLAPSLAWSRRPGAEAAGADFAEGHANAVVAGNSGIERHRDVSIGISVMAPNIQYPDHRHPPEEVYVVLSPGAGRQGEAPWFEPGVGGIVYNPPDIVHAMKSRAAPLLAVWCLWEGR
ncbi:MAG: dimethylsulfonioproprionate lyase family protein [Hyphomicrobiales bacterium]